MPLDNNPEIGPPAKASLPKGQVGCAGAPDPIRSRPSNRYLPKGHVAHDGRDLTLPAAAEPARKGKRSSSAAAKRPLPQGQWCHAAALDELCAILAGLQRQRVFAIRQHNRISSALKAFVRVQLGYHEDLPERERKRLAAAAQAIVAAGLAGKDYAGKASDAARAVAAQCLPEIILTRDGLAGWAVRRKDTEDMMNIAQGLPAQQFVAATRGFSLLGLAVVVGEAGNLADYPTKGHLWSQLGLALELDGLRQGRVPAGLSREARAAAWQDRKYNPARRAQIWSFLDDSLMRHQWRGAVKDDAGAVVTAARAIGPYGAYYGRKRAEYAERFAGEKGGAAHADAAARRYMAKQFLRDLWRAWRAEIGTPAVAR